MQKVHIGRNQSPIRTILWQKQLVICPMNSTKEHLNWQPLCFSTRENKGKPGYGVNTVCKKLTHLTYPAWQTKIKASNHPRRGWLQWYWGDIDVTPLKKGHPENFLRKLQVLLWRILQWYKSQQRRGRNQDRKWQHSYILWPMEQNGRTNSLLCMNGGIGARCFGWKAMLLHYYWSVFFLDYFVELILMKG